MKNSIYQIMRDRILFMEYQPGQILNEKILGEEFGISRSPVRDVLNRLEWEQLVRIIPRTGSMVTEIEFSKIMNVFQVRFESEPFETQLAGDQLNKTHLDILAEQAKKCDSLFDNKNRKALAEIDFAIRDMIHNAAGNPVLKEVNERLYTQTFRLWYVVMDKGDWNEEVKSMAEEVDEMSDLIVSKNTGQFGDVRRKRINKHFERLRQKFFNGAL
ncbi:MAG: GntR family transcriptional regulator [Desulfotignum sp.]|nr:GntR family transcriptional regulator [Desulfotignum sp.]MCF8126226.1 GntR family transcriptional regulator [Desulfotignum sp.]